MRAHDARANTRRASHALRDCEMSQRAVSCFAVSVNKKKPRLHNDAHTPPTRIAMSSNATLGVEAHARKRNRECGDANGGEAFPRLPNHLVVACILRSEHFDDPADLARLLAVSRAMRDLVAEAGLRFKELHEDEAVELGCLSAVQRLQRGGRLSRQELLCGAAARSGQLEELTVLRADGCPWDEGTCYWAAKGGHLEVLQWARARGCPWDANTCAWAARGGHLDVLQWARANRCRWDERTCAGAAWGGHLEVLKWAREGLSMAREDVRERGAGRAPRGAAVGAR